MLERVLRRIGYTAPAGLLEQIAQAKQGYVETLLFEVKQRIDKILQTRQQNQKGHDRHVSMTAEPPLPQQVQISHQMDESYVKSLQETVQILQLKIQKLEQLLTIKDQRILELERYL